MVENNRCANCGHRVTNEMIQEHKGFRLNPNYYVCLKCYEIYFERARDYVYKNPNASRQIISKFTNLPLKLIDLFCEEGGLIEVANNKRLTDEMNKQQIQEEKDERTLKLQRLNELKNSLTQKPESSMQRVIKQKESDKMFFLNSDRRRR